MFGREKLEIFGHDDAQFFLVEDANAVMDKMEARIKELEATNYSLDCSLDRLQRNSSSSVYKKRIEALQIKVAMLSDENDSLVDELNRISG